MSRVSPPPSLTQFLDEMIPLLEKKKTIDLQIIELHIQAAIKAYNKHLKANPYDFEDNMQKATWLTSTHNWHRLTPYAVGQMLKNNHEFIQVWDENEKLFFLDTAIDSQLITFYSSLREAQREKAYERHVRGEKYERQRKEEMINLEDIQKKIRAWNASQQDQETDISLI